MSLHDDEPDPTGMRELLRGLPDPGPMPDDLVARIRSSLAGLPDLEPAGAEGADELAVSRGTHPGGRTARASWWVRSGPRVAVAAAVLLGGGAVASSQLGLLASGGDSASSTSDTAAGGGGASQPVSGADENFAGPMDGGRDSAGRGGAHHLDGDVDEVRTYAGVLSPDEIRALGRS